MGLNHHLDIIRAARRRRRFAAPVIAVTGSSGKSTTSALLAHILEGHGKVGKQVMENGALSIAWSFLNMPMDVEHIVVEAGVGKPGDMDGLARLVQPDIAVVTMVASEHYKTFRGEEAVEAEKGKLVAALRPGGLAVLNGDDTRVMRMAERTKARILRFGESEGCEYRYQVTDLTLTDGLSLDLHTPAGVLALHTTARIGYFAANYAAAAAVALELGVSPEIVRQQIASFAGVRDRFQYRQLAKGTQVIFDAAKAPHHSLHRTLEAFGLLQAPHKRIVLGQISDTRGKNRNVYFKAIEIALANADEVVLVGENAAREGRKLFDKSRLGIHETQREAADYLRASLRQDELILLKSARNLHLERLIMALEQDVKCWKNQCKIRYSCPVCGLWPEAPEDHARILRHREFARLLGPLARFMPAHR